MTSKRSVKDRVRQALQMLDWLATEVPALELHHAALRLDEMRDLLSPAAES